MAGMTNKKLHDTDFDITLIVSLLERICHCYDIDSWELPLINSNFNAEKYAKIINYLTDNKKYNHTFIEFREYFYKVGDFEMEDIADLDGRIENLLNGFLKANVLEKSVTKILNTKKDL
ncbi:MAG: hypothetical protein LBI43_07095 [Streptococcaceae bacterium]|jgi:hypothetical protein|nr:hypothetical protein [Streptococcaceae bacterium]